MRKIQKTSIDAYHDLNLGVRQLQVYEVIRDLKYACNMDIAKELDIPINQITGRTRELVQMGAVREYDRLKNPITKRTVIYWEVIK